MSGLAVCYWHGSVPCDHKDAVDRLTGGSYLRPAPGCSPVVLGTASESIHPGQLVCVDEFGRIRRYVR